MSFSGENDETWIVALTDCMLITYAAFKFAVVAKREREILGILRCPFLTNRHRHQLQSHQNRTVQEDFGSVRIAASKDWAK